MTRLLQATLLLCAIASTAVIPRAARGADENERLLAHGTEQMYWVAKVAPVQSPNPGATPPAPPAWRSIVQARTNGGQRWHLLSRLDAPIASMTNRSESVAVLLASGDWMLLWSGGGTIGKPLPGKSRMLALAGGPDSFWAVGRGNLAALRAPSISTTSINADESPAPRGATTVPTTLASAPVSSSATEQGLGLFEFVGNQWLLRGELPDDFYADGSDDLSLSVASSRPIVALRDQGRQVHVISLDRDGRLTDLGNVGRQTSFKLMGAGQPLMLWTASGSPAGSIYRVDQLSSVPKALTPPAKFNADSPMSVASALGSIRLVFQRDGTAYEQTYSISGEPRGEPLPLPLAEPAAVDRFPEWLTIPLLLLLLLLLFSPARRRELPSSPATTSDARASAAASRTAPGETSSSPLTIAPTRLRFTAGVVDALPMIIVSMYIAATVHASEPEDFADVMYSWRWVLYAATGVYMLHTTLSELFTQRTFGKWIFGLRVVSLDGRRPGVVALLARNALRLIDINLLFPLLLVAVTPYHQRLGDLVARTVVVAEDWQAGDDDSEE
jgi:uncharacterized RDD family membrane protein YckC